MQSKLNRQILQAYADAGFTLFPLNGKVPPKGYRWTKAEYNPFPQPSDFPHGNYGVKLGPEDLVIDVDPRNFPPERKILNELAERLGFKIIGHSFTVRTGTGGAHIYYHKSAEHAVRGAIRDLPGLDIKSEGGYVVGPGSIHPDSGNPYDIHSGSPANITRVPAELLALIERKEEIHEAPKNPIEYTDDKQTQDRFVQYLRTAPVAIEGQSGDRTTFAVAAVGHDFGLHPDICLSLMSDHYNDRCEPPWAHQELQTKVYNAYRYSGEVAGAKSAIGQFTKALPVQSVSDLRCNRRGEPYSTVYNTVTALNIDMPGTLALNVWTEDLVFLKPAPWHDADEIPTYWEDSDSARLKYFLGKERHFEPKSQNIEDALVTVGRYQKFHPIKRELESYKWDGIPRINDWMVKFLGVEDSAYHRNVGLKVLVAAIKRLYEPGCKFDYIMVLEGKQGIGKSRAIQILAGEYYGDIDINLHDKETIEAMRRFWIIEASEMETHRKQESTAMKAFLSRQVDVFRVPYARRAKQFPRQSIFIGSINPENCEDIGWLKDATGNRRYWPVACRQINQDGLRKVRNQLWAEALLHYKKGTPVYFEDVKIEEQAMLEQQKRIGADAWHERIVEWLTYGLGKNRMVVTASNMYCDCLGGSFAHINRIEQRRISDIMKSLGWEKGVFHSSEVGGTVRGYRRPGIVQEAEAILK